MFIYIQISSSIINDMHCIFADNMAAVENAPVPLQQVAKKSSAKPAQYLNESDSAVPECPANTDTPSHHKSHGDKNNGVRLTNGVGDSEGESLEDGEIVDSDVEESSRKRNSAELDEAEEVKCKIPKLSNAESPDVNLPLNGDQLVVDTACRVSDSEQLDSDRNMSESENSQLSSINSPDEFTETTEPIPESSERQPPPKCVQNSESNIPNHADSPTSKLLSECSKNESNLDTPQSLPTKETADPEDTNNEMKSSEDNEPIQTAASPNHPIESVTTPTRDLLEESARSPVSPQEGARSPASPKEGAKSPVSPQEDAKSPGSPHGSMKSLGGAQENAKSPDAVMQSASSSESPHERAMSPNDAIQSVPSVTDPEEGAQSPDIPTETGASCNPNIQSPQDVSENSSSSADATPAPSNFAEELPSGTNSVKSATEESESVGNMEESGVAASGPNSPLFSEDSNSSGKSSLSGCAKMTFNLAQSKINISESFKGSLKEIISKVSEGDKDLKDNDDGQEEKESSRSSHKPDLTTSVNNTGT